jgi:hypothetical protein
MRNFEENEILPSWEVSFAAMPLKLWTSLDCSYKRCPARYFAISTHLTDSQILQLFFLLGWTVLPLALSILSVPPLTSVWPLFLPAPPR